MTQLETQLLNTLYLALPYVEQAASDTSYKPGRVAAMVHKMRSVIAAAESAAQPPVAGQHTPGPWSVWTYGAEDARNVAVGPVAGGLAVADVVQCNAHGIHTAETEALGMANAALIAKAPALDAALRLLLSRADALDQSATHDGLLNCEALATARAALS